MNELSQVAATMLRFRLVEEVIGIIIAVPVILFIFVNVLRIFREAVKWPPEDVDRPERRRRRRNDPSDTQGPRH